MTEYWKEIFELVRTSPKAAGAVALVALYGAFVAFTVLQWSGVI